MKEKQTVGSQWRTCNSFHTVWLPGQSSQFLLECPSSSTSMCSGLPGAQHHTKTHRMRHMPPASPLQWPDRTNTEDKGVMSGHGGQHWGQATSPPGLEVTTCLLRKITQHTAQLPPGSPHGPVPSQTLAGTGGRR